jgi:hypothetical protein
LAAVASFLASLPQNVIPPSVDPSRSIDPQLVLDFDTRGPRAADELRTIVEDVWTQNPVVLFTKVRSLFLHCWHHMLTVSYIAPFINVSRSQVDNCRYASKSTTYHI